MEPGRKARPIGAGDTDSIYLPEPGSWCWEEQKLALESERDEASLSYKLESQGSSQRIQQSRKVELQSDNPVGDKKSSRVTALAARLRQLDEALHRIRTGRYGLCTSCGIEIGRARLDRDLATQYCTLCQDEAEIRNGRYTL